MKIKNLNFHQGPNNKISQVKDGKNNNILFLIIFLITLFLSLILFFPPLIFVWLVLLFPPGGSLTFLFLFSKYYLD